uniref:Right handed beta helix domain-containing protein n=1 Tax=Amphimedon queenslandica TaxID=400682 RepID=A0A1X7SQ93_AMPQE
MNHGTSYNISVIIDNLNIINSGGVYYRFTESLFSLYAANSSVSNTYNGFESHFSESLKSKDCNVKGVESLSVIEIEDCRFHNNLRGLLFTTDEDYFQSSNHHVAIIVKSCSISDNSYGLFIDGGLLTSSTHISVIDIELVGNGRNEIIRCLSILLDNITVTNSLSTGLVIIASAVTVENRLVFKNNTGEVGGGMAVNDSSIVALSPSANLEFIDNHATYIGGGIYIDENSKFQFKQNSSSIPLTLKDNTAGVAGNDIYGFIASFSYFNLTNPNISSSHPVMAFFCDPDNNGTIPIDTDIYETQNHDEFEQQIFPGQLL